MNKVTLHNSNGAEEGVIMGPAVDAGTGKLKAYTTSSATLDDAVTGNFIDVTCTSNAYIRITDSTSPAAATSADYYVTSGLTYRFPISGSIKVSAIGVTAGGTLHVHPVS